MRRLRRRAVAPFLGVLFLAALAVVLLWRSPPSLPAPLAGSEPPIVAYFTQPLIPDRPDRHRGGLDERLVALIDQAQQSLEVAVYDFDLQNVAEAMARAARRGVRVRMVTDTDTRENQAQPAVQRAFRLVEAAGIPIIDDRRPAIMHHKFAIIDGRLVLTGSWNFTEGDTYRLNNNAVVLRSPEVAADFQREFEQLFSERRFGRAKRPVTPYPRVTVGTAVVETLFAPQDRVAQRLSERIRAARTTIRFLAFSFTHDGLGNAVLERHRAGVRVEGVIERVGAETPFSEYRRLKAAGVAVYLDGNPYAMHHKVFILDDRVVAFGSFNFSRNADEENDENLLIVEDTDLARAFTEEFARVLALARQAEQRAAGGLVLRAR